MPVYTISSSEDSLTSSINTHDEFDDNEQEDDHSLVDQDIFQKEQQIFMRFSAKGLNKTNSLELESNLKKIYDSVNLNISNFRKLLKIEQIYSRLNKNMAKKRAIIKLLNDAIIEDNRHLQQLGIHYIRKLKRYRKQGSRNEHNLINMEYLCRNRPLEKRFMEDSQASPAMLSLAAGMPPTLLKNDTVLSEDAVLDISNELSPGHLIYLLTISNFTCTLCINKFLGANMFILDCCRQHICLKCYIKCKTGKCPFCRKAKLIAVNFSPKIFPIHDRQSFRCTINEHIELIGQADDFDDVTEIYRESTANDFAKRHLDDMAVHYIFHHI